jgi:hypothetical protein
MRVIRYLALLGCVLAVVTCVASEPPKLTKAEVMQMALDFARQQKWDIKSIWKDMPDFEESRREWRVLINTKQNGGPMIVRIKDDTREIYFERGE